MMKPIVLNSTFEEWFDRAKKMEQEVFAPESGLKPEARHRSFFPNQESQFQIWLKRMEGCCGVLELRSMGLSGGKWGTGYKTIQTRYPSLSPEDMDRITVAWVLGTYEKICGGTYSSYYFNNPEFRGPGLIIYPYPFGNKLYQPFADILVEFGFESLIQFPNFIHEGHRLDMLACYTHDATQAVKKGTISWLGASDTTRAQSAARATM